MTNITTFIAILIRIQAMFQITLENQSKGNKKFQQCIIYGFNGRYFDKEKEVLSIEMKKVGMQLMSYHLMARNFRIGFFSTFFWYLTSLIMSWDHMSRSLSFALGVDRSMFHLTSSLISSRINDYN